MSFSFTEDQRLAIESRGGTILVSAAAGSGKTRVLTERLLRYVCDPDAPEDVDRFLVITYTRAAAAELRARIMEAIAAQAAANPGDARLRRQQSLCCRAPIGTIHSFCTTLLREHCQQLGISPAFTVADEERTDAMKQSVCARLLDKAYENIENDAAFRLLADTVGAGRNDSRLEKTLLELYEKLRSHPDPAAWCARQRQILALDGVHDCGETVWGQAILRRAQRSAAWAAQTLEDACGEMAAADEKIRKAYGTAFADAAGQLRRFCRAAEDGWDAACAAAQIAFPGLKPLRKYPDPELQARMKTLWNACKNSVKRLPEWFSAGSEAQLADLRAAAPAMQALLTLAEAFEAAYSAEKRRRGLLDFSDLEHLSAQLLADPDTGAPTPLARELSRRYTEILVDEYQDVNAVQELIFRSVSREGRNLFLVGDVKQSIYRFRLADPTLFLEKYARFAPAELAQPGEARRILLRENFRSRRSVLDAANLVFGCIMSEELGELDYDCDAALRCGARNYDPAGDRPVEFHIIDPVHDGDETPADSELEARFIAGKILEMVRGGAPVTDKDGNTRPCSWGDFVLLMRTPGGKGKTFHRVLAEAGIPVESQQGSGFFTSLEVSVTIDLLAVIDNPHADVPLISVLRSPAFGFTGDELSAVRVADRDSDFYGALCAAAAGGDAHSAAFLSQLDTWRDLAPELELGTLIWRLYSDTNLLAVCTAMRDGEMRRRNLMRLFEYARSFGENGYHGLFRFVQWLRRLSEKGAEPDMGMVGQAVRIMSIHKSKGLEFPFVFLCDLSHRFNTADMRGGVLLHSALGLGPKRVDAAQGFEYPTLARRAVALQCTDEQLSEEMRVLYVGMTRAKERLFLSCVWKNADEALEELRRTATEPMPPEALRSASSFAPWLAAAALQHPETLPITVQRLRASDAEATAIAEAPSVAPPPELCAKVSEKLDFVYPHAGSVDLPSKLSATELKGTAEADGDAAQLTAPPEELQFRAPAPGQGGALTAAQRGTATHAFLQYVELARTDSLASLEAEAERLNAAGRLSAAERDAIDLPAVRRFFTSPLGQRIRAAADVRRELRFMLLRSAAAYFDGAAPDDEILLQGVVDCCLIEPDGVTIVDYKTDRVTTAEAPERAERYRGQLACYAEALERIFARPVKKCALWFLSCGAEVELDPKIR